MATSDTHDDQDDQALAPQPTPVETPVVRQTGLGTLIFGGAVAAALGYGAAYLTLPKVDLGPLEARLTAQDKLIAQQANALKELGSATPDLSGVESAIAQSGSRIDDLATQLSANAQAATSQFAQIDQRITSVELRAENGVADMTTVTAYERELKELRAELLGATQTAEERIASLEANASQVAAASSELQAEADAARSAAETARAQAALETLRAALSSAEPFDAPLAVLATHTDLPAALTDYAADGVPSQNTLLADYPAAARAALAVARADGSAEAEGAQGNRLGSLFRKQFGLRSTTPRDGSSADAILSRVEAALRQADLGTVLSEADALPQTAQDAMSDWLSAARIRHGALEASAALHDQLTAK